MELSKEPEITHYAIVAVDGEVEIGSHLSVSEAARELYKLLGMTEH